MNNVPSINIFGSQAAYHKKNQGSGRGVYLANSLEMIYVHGFFRFLLKSESKRVKSGNFSSFEGLGKTLLGGNKGSHCFLVYCSFGGRVEVFCGIYVDSTRVNLRDP